MDLQQLRREDPDHWRRDPGSTSGRARVDINREKRRIGPETLLGPAIVIGVAVALYGVGARRDVAASVGFGVLAVIALAVALAAHASARRSGRRCEVLGRARAESERARHDLQLANIELEHRNTDLERERHAISNGFEYMDEQTAGRLRALLDAAGCDLAELADFVLDEPDEEP